MNRLVTFGRSLVLALAIPVCSLAPCAGCRSTDNREADKKAGDDLSPKGPGDSVGTAPESPASLAPEQVPTPVSPGEFPAGFAFGTAIAGFQVEMGCPTLPKERCEDRGSDWYQWITTPRITRNPLLFMSKDPPEYAPGFFELYEHDVDLAAQDLHNNALRISIEWSRIFPRETFGVEGYEALSAVASAEGIAFYHRVLAAMRARGLSPFVTVNHYSLPLWIHDGNACNQDLNTCTNKGWVDRARIVPEIAKYAGFVAREFGAEVDTWATLNEPFSAVTLPGYLTPSSTRTNPPGLYLKADAAKTATLAMIEAHARMYDAIKANDRVDADGDGQTSLVGIVYNVTAVEPSDENEADKAAANDARYFLNDMFLRAVAKGIVDEGWDGNVVTRADLQNRLEYLGVNYYARIKAQATRLGPLNPLRFVSKYLTFNLLNMRTDMDYAKGVYDVLLDAKKYGVPMLVSETGGEQGKDPVFGARWLVQTLSWVKKAVEEGADVRGYYLWSLMDNYEWNHGMNLKFGVYAVDPTNPEKPRVPREAAGVYARIARERRVSEELVEKYGVRR